jgi:hypothetical protein
LSIYTLVILAFTELFRLAITLVRGFSWFGEEFIEWFSPCCEFDVSAKNSFKDFKAVEEDMG